MSALLHIKDRRNPRKKLPDAVWRGVDNGTHLEIDGERKGPVDWNRSRFLDGNLWAWIDGTYYVLDKDKDVDHPPTEMPDFGPVLVGDSDDLEDTNSVIGRSLRVSAGRRKVSRDDVGNDTDGGDSLQDLRREDSSATGEDPGRDRDGDVSDVQTRHDTSYGTDLQLCSSSSSGVVDRNITERGRPETIPDAQVSQMSDSFGRSEREVRGEVRDRQPEAESGTRTEARQVEEQKKDKPCDLHPTMVCGIVRCGGCDRYKKQNTQCGFCGMVDGCTQFCLPYPSSSSTGS